jgi:hypothetical protein
LTVLSLKVVVLQIADAFCRYCVGLTAETADVAAIRATAAANAFARVQVMP